MSEGTERPQRFCTNCGAKVGSGGRFCASCGSVLSPTDDAENARYAPGSRDAHDEPPNNAASRPDAEVAGRSPKDIHREYDLHRRFFREAREGLIRLSEGLKDEADGPRGESSLNRNDLAPSLLYAQRGLNKVEEYGPLLTSVPNRESSQSQAQAALADLRGNREEVLASLEDFYDKLKSVEGWAGLKDDFAKWYTDNLEQYIRNNRVKTREPAPAQSGSSNVSSDGDAAKTLSPSRDPGVPRSANTGEVGPSSPSVGGFRSLVGWFKELSVAFKALAAVAGVLLTLFILISPDLSAKVFAWVFGISFVIAAVLLFLQKPLSEWLSRSFSISFFLLAISLVVLGISESSKPPYNGSGTSVLDSIVRGGMVNSDENIVAVEVRGEEATVVISSDAPSGYAESVCDFALGSALEFDNQAGYEDYIGITHVTVRKQWRPWSVTSCSL